MSNIFDDEYFDALLECLNPIYYDIDIVNEVSIVTEAKKYRPKVQVGQIWMMEYPHLNFANTDTHRRAIIYQNANGDLAALMCSKVAGKSKDYLNKPYNIKIVDWASQGFKKETFIAGCTLLPLSYVKLDYYVGQASTDTLNKCKEATRKAEEFKFKEPFALLNWMKNYIISDTSHPSGNNNANKVQSLQDVIRTKKVNCVDVANIVHCVCRNNKITHSIVWIRYKLSENHTEGHLYCMYKEQGHPNKAFRFVPLNPPIGDLITQSGSIEIAIKNENDEWKKSFEDRYGSGGEFECTVISGKQLKEWDNCVRKGMTQAELLSHMTKINLAQLNNKSVSKMKSKKNKSSLNENFANMIKAETPEEIYFQSILEYATESNNWLSKDSNLILSEDDIYCNFWDFENKRTHYCFVIGFSGSGKTNLARNLAKKYNAEWVSLDVLLYDSRMHKMTERFVSGHQKQRLLAKYLKENDIDLSYMKDVQYKDTPEARATMVETGRRFINWLINKNEERVIIEGLDLVDIIPTEPSLYSAPIVFKGTSRLTSMFRRIQRSKFKTPLAAIMNMFKWYKTDAHGIDYLRSIVISDYNTQYRQEPGVFEKRPTYDRKSY